MAILREQAAALATGPILPTTPAAPAITPIIVRDETALAGLAADVAAAVDVVVDLETSGLDPHAGVIVGIGIALAELTYYVPIHHCFDDGRLRPGQLTLPDVLAALHLESKSLVNHNVKFDMKWLHHHGAPGIDFTWDTMLAARLLRSDLPADLEAAAMRELDVPAWDLPKEDKIRMQFLPIERVAVHVQVTLTLGDLQAGDRCRLATVDVEDGEGRQCSGFALDGDPRTIERRGVGDVRQRLAQADRAGRAGLEVDDVCPGMALAALRAARRVVALNVPAPVVVTMPAASPNVVTA